MASLASLALRAKTLEEQKEGLIEEVKAFAETKCTAADFKGVDADGFKRLKKIMQDAFFDTDSYEFARLKDAEWSKCFADAQSYEDDGTLTALLDSQTLDAKEVRYKKTHLLRLLHDTSTDKQQEWCRVVAALDGVTWLPEEIKNFPIALCRAYINAHHPIAPRGKTYDYDPEWLGDHEVFLCHLLHGFFDRLTAQERAEAARGINQHSVGECPLGSQIRKIVAEGTEGTGDVLPNILDAYKSDPLSLECRYRRRLQFNTGRYTFTVPFQVVGCHNSSEVEFLFPDLCYVFPTSIKVRYHTLASYTLDAGSCHVLVNSRIEVPYRCGWKQTKQQKSRPDCDRSNIEEETIVLNGSVCKSISIKSPLLSSIHDIEIFGSVLLLF